MEVSITITGKSDDEELQRILLQLSGGRHKLSFAPLHPGATPEQIIKKKNKTEEDIAAFVSLLSAEKQRLYNIISPLEVGQKAIALSDNDISSSASGASLLNNTRMSVYQLAKSVFKGKKFRTIRINGDLTIMRTR